MMWNLKNKVFNVIDYNINDWVQSLKKGYLIYYPSVNHLKIYSLIDLDLIADRKFEETSNSFYYIDDFRLFINQDNRLYESDFHLSKLEELCCTTEERIAFIGRGFCIGNTSKRRPRISRSEIIRITDCKIQYTWDDDKELIKWDTDLHLFQTKFKGDLFAIDPENNGLLWKLILDDGIPGRRYLYFLSDKKLVAQRFFDVDSSNLLLIDLRTGCILWELANTLSFYNYDDSLGMLYGLGDRTFEVINVKTGKRELQKELDINLRVSAHLTYYAKDHLYFSGYLNNNIPVFGAINVTSGNLVFTRVIDIPGEKSFRNGLDRPIVIGNRLYVRDTMSTLYIFERSEPS